MSRPWRAVKHLWLGVTLIAAASAFLLLSDAGQRHGGRGAGAKPRAAILSFSSLAVLDDGVHGLIDQLRANGYEDGRTMVLDRFNAQNDMATATSMAKELTSGRYEYVFSISTNCLQAVANANREGRAKHIFGVVADPVAAKVGIDANDPSRHPPQITGIGTLMPVSEVMELARVLNPRVRRFGIPWNPSQANSERYVKAAREAAAAMGVELVEGAVDTTAAVGEVTASIVSRGADCILVIGDVTVGLGIDAVIAAARSGRVPVLSVLPDAVPRGALIGVGADFYQVGRQMGDMATRVLRGESPARIPIQYSLPKQYAVNLKAMEGLKDRWQVPADLVEKAGVLVDETGVHKKAP